MYTFKHILLKANMLNMRTPYRTTNRASIQDYTCNDTSEHESNNRHKINKDRTESAYTHNDHNSKKKHCKNKLWP